MNSVMNNRILSFTFTTFWCYTVGAIPRERIPVSDGDYDYDSDNDYYSKDLQPAGARLKIITTQSLLRGTESIPVGSVTLFKLRPFGRAVSPVVKPRT